MSEDNFFAVLGKLLENPEALKNAISMAENIMGNLNQSNTNTDSNNTSERNSSDINSKPPEPTIQTQNLNNGNTEASTTSANPISNIGLSEQNLSNMITTMAPLLSGLMGTGNHNSSGNQEDENESINLRKSQKKNDQRCALLRSLKPFLKESRSEKLEMIIKAIQLADLTGGLLDGKKLF